MQFSIPVDMNTVETEFKPLDPGDYPVKILAVTPEVSKKSGKPYLTWELEVLPGPNGCEGRRLYDRTSLQANAAFSLKRVLIGFGITWRVCEGQTTFNDEEALGATAIAVVKMRTYKDEETGEQKVSNEIDSFRPLGE